MLEVRCLHLFAQKLLINKAIEYGAPLVAGELAPGTSVEQRFIAERVIPITLQDNAAVDRRHDAIDDLGCPRQLRTEHSQHDHQSTDGRDSLHTNPALIWPTNLAQFHHNG